MEWRGVGRQIYLLLPLKILIPKEFGFIYIHVAVYMRDAMEYPLYWIIALSCT